MAASRLKPYILVRQHGLAVVSVQQRFQSTDVVDVKPLPTTKLSALKRGTGGRSSFSGVVATVFGATGFLGRYVVNKLGKQGSQVVVPYRGNPDSVRRIKLSGDLGQVLFMPMYLKDENTLYKAMKYSNVVINLIGKDNPTPNFSFRDVHVTGARQIARIARESGVERLIHVSTLNAAEKPQGTILKGGSQFLSSKWEGEQVVRQEFPEAIIFRPADIYGQEDRFLNYYTSFWRRDLLLIPLWNKGIGIIKQPVFASDVASGIAKAAVDPDALGKTYQAVGPKRYELTELVDWMYQVIRRTREFGYIQINMKYDLLFWLRVALAEKIGRVSPYMTWDKIERECITDTVLSELPTLEDLGVNITPLEDRIKWELRNHRAWAYYDAEPGEYPEPIPPQPR